MSLRNEAGHRTDFTERQREQILTDIHTFEQALNKLTTPLIRCEIADLGEHIAKLEHLLTTLITRVRTLA